MLSPPLCPAPAVPDWGLPLVAGAAALCGFSAGPGTGLGRRQRREARPGPCRPLRILSELLPPRPRTSLRTCQEPGDGTGNGRATRRAGAADGPPVPAVLLSSALAAKHCQVPHTSRRGASRGPQNGFLSPA